MKISPIVLLLRQKCSSFKGRIGGTADIPIAETSTNLPLPCAFVLAPRDAAEDVAMQTRYVQNVVTTFDIMLYVSAASDERGLDAYDVADELKAEIIQALAGYEPSDCTDWISFDSAEVAALNAAYLAYRLTFRCAYTIDDAYTYHGELIENLPRFLRLQTNVVGIEGDPTGQTPIASQRIAFPED